MKKKILCVVSATLLVGVILFYFSISNNIMEEFISIKEGDSKSFVIKKMGKNFVDGSDFVVFSEDDHLIEVYFWRENKRVYFKKNSFPYFAITTDKIDFIIHFTSEKVIHKGAQLNETVYDVLHEQNN